MKTAAPGLKINAWYLDDGTLCGSRCDLATALWIIEEDGPPCGLHLNRAKSLLYVPANSSFSPYTVKSLVCVTHQIWCATMFSIRTPFLACNAHHYIKCVLHTNRGVSRTPTIVCLAHQPRCVSHTNRGVSHTPTTVCPSHQLWRVLHTPTTVCPAHLLLCVM